MSNDTNLIPITELPKELSTDATVELTYREDLDWIEAKLRLGLSVLVECDKQLTLQVYRALRTRLKGKTPSIGCTLCSGHSALQAEGPTSLMQGILNELREQIYGGQSEKVVVIPHLDVLTTTTQSGLNLEARESIAMVFENPNIVLLGFKDPQFEIPKVLVNVFAVQRKIMGIPRDTLSRVILQKEARKLGVETFNPFNLYKYVSGLNVIRFRQIMSHLHSKVDFDTCNEGSAEAIYKEIRQMTLVADMELPSVNLDTEIGGYKKVKKQLKEEVLELLAMKQKMTDAAEIKRIEEIVPKGMIFLGPPGTGKTFFAKAMATALNATVIIVSGPELKSKWVGESEQKIRQVFAKARQSAPSIIVFDEIDSFATARGTYAGSGVEHSMVNQLLTEMDGFRKDELVFVVGTTNFSESLDPALLRPGRFELLIEIPYPNKEDREEICEIYQKKFKLDIPEEVMEFIVEKTGAFVDQSKGTRFSGDHIYAIFRGLLREQLREGRKAVSKDAVMRTLKTKQKGKIVLSKEEERRVAIHESGHAMCAYFLPNISRIEKITIASDHEDALGYVLREAEENKYITTKEELEENICMLLAGRVAEQMILGSISVGAHDDLQKASKIARAMLEELGMGMTLGLRSLGNREGFGHTSIRENISPGMEEALDTEIRRLLQKQEAKATELLTDNREKFELLIQTLLEKKTLVKGELEELFKDTEDDSLEL
ncbi:MAG: AAA family ATPase [Desulfobulbaceae bacterium]|nr:AAA family ATPase [Desulfobulbaceae bacterium]